MNNLLGNIPTDNFYKFQFIAGIVVILFSVFYLNEEINSQEKELIKIEGERKKLEVEMDYVEYILDQRDETLDHNENDKNGSIAELLSLLENNDSLSERNLKMNKNLAAINTRYKLVEETVKDIKGYRILMSIFGGIAGVWILYGYYGWYNHQKLIDRNLEKNAKVHQENDEKYHT